MSRLSRPSNLPLLCYVTDRQSLASTETSGTRQPFDRGKILLEKIAGASAAGVNWIQIREKDLSGKECSSLTREAVRIATSSSPGAAAKAPVLARTKAARELSCIRILVNNRLDIALAAQAAGVHLGENTIPPEEAQRLAKSLHREKEFLVGLSCHSLEAAKMAEHHGADYVLFGPVFATPSKAAFGQPQGLKGLAEICRSVAIPVLAIGGITLENAADCLSEGASGIAAIRLFQDAPDIGAVVRALQKLST